MTEKQTENWLERFRLGVAIISQAAENIDSIEVFPGLTVEEADAELSMIAKAQEALDIWEDRIWQVGAARDSPQLINEILDSLNSKQAEAAALPSRPIRIVWTTQDID